MANGVQQLYEVKETIQVNSGWTNVLWPEGLQIVAQRSQILQGDPGNPQFWTTVNGLSFEMGKGDSVTVEVQIEALVIKGNASATVNVTKGALGYTRVDLFAWNLPVANFSELAPFPLNTTSGAAVSVGLQQLYSLPSGTMNVGDAIKGMSKMVIAPLFPWYGNPSGPSKEWWHWGNPPGMGITNTTMVNTADYPLMGTYDSGDPSIISAQMAMAKYAGIDAFTVTWWGIGDFTDNQMKPILNVAQQTGMKIMACFCTPPSDRTTGSVVNELVYLVRTYASYPAYYKDAGRPVFFVYASTAGPNGTVTPPSFWENVRKQVQAQVGKVVLIGDNLEGAEAADPSDLGAFDGTWVYTDVTQYAAGNIEQWYANTAQALSVGLNSSQTMDQAFAAAYAGGQVDFDRKFYVFTVTPGNDNTKVATPGIKLDRANGTVYARQWDAAISQGAEAVFISSWNEWHEGAEIEPSVQYGFTYVDLTRQFTQEYRGVVLPGLEPKFSAVTEGTSGQLHIVITAATATPALMTKVDVKSVGSTYPTISGNYTSYRNYQNATFATAQVPFVGSHVDVTISVPHQAPGSATDLQVSVSSYDPSGREYVLFKGPVVVSTPAVTSTSESTTSAATTSSSTSTSASTSAASSSLGTSTGTGTSSSGGEGIPEFPYQYSAASILIAVVALSYLAFRRGQSVPAADGD
jgi:hypothetical protein